MKDYNYRITEWFGLEGTFRSHLVKPPCSEQGLLQLDQVAQSPVQPGLEHFHGWGLPYISDFQITKYVSDDKGITKISIKCAINLLSFLRDILIGYLTAAAWSNLCDQFNRKPEVSPFRVLLPVRHREIYLLLPLKQPFS